MRVVCAALAAGLAVSAGGPAQADILKFVANSAAQNFTTPTELTINQQNGAFAARFKVKKESAVVVTFAAECLVTGNNGSYLDIDILVKLEGEATFSAIPPTDGDNSLCAPGTNTGNYWVSASVSGGQVMPVGNHTVKILAKPTGTLTNVRIDDLSVTVIECGFPPPEQPARRGVARRPLGAAKASPPTTRRSLARKTCVYSWLGVTGRP